MNKEEDRFIIGEVIMIDSFKSCTVKEKLFVYPVMCTEN